MQILIDLTVLELPATGVAKVLTGLYSAVATGYPDIAVAGIHRRHLVTLPPPGVRIEQLGRGLPAKLWRRVVIPYASRISHGAIVHFPWNGGVPPLPPDRRVITTLHDVLPLTIPGFFPSEDLAESYRRNRQRDADRSSVVVTDSEFSKREIIKHLCLAREPVVIPCATSIGELAPGVIPTKQEYFLYVGGLDRRKSVDSLLRVFFRLKTEGVLRSTLVVTGSTRHAPPELATMLDEGKRRGCVELAGYVDDRELARLYAGALALVYPSQYEGFGMPPLEAMTMGCPVIAPRASSLPEVCANAAYYIDPWSDLGLGEALLKIESDPALRVRLGNEGRRRAAAFSWARAAEAFVHVLQTFI